MTTENQLNKRELQRLEDLFHDGWSLRRISERVTDDGREDFTPNTTGIRGYLHRSGLWPRGTPRPKMPEDNMHYLIVCPRKFNFGRRKQKT